MKTPDPTTASVFNRYLSGEGLADSAALQWTGLYVRLCRLPRVVDSFLVPATPEPLIPATRMAKPQTGCREGAVRSIKARPSLEGTAPSVPWNRPRDSLQSYSAADEWSGSTHLSALVIGDQNWSKSQVRHDSLGRKHQPSAQIEWQDVLDAAPEIMPHTQYRPLGRLVSEIK